MSLSGPAIVRAQQLGALSAAAAGGNASAAKTLFGLAGKKTESPAPKAGTAGGGDLAARALRILDGGRK